MHVRVKDMYVYHKLAVGDNNERSRMSDVHIMQ